MVTPLAQAGISVGADGVIVEVHPNPKEALCDGEQSLKPAEFANLVIKLDKVAKAIDKKLAV